MRTHAMVKGESRAREGKKTNLVFSAFNLQKESQKECTKKEFAANFFFLRDRTKKHT